MTAEKALKKWHYNNRKLERLIEICKNNPHKYMRGKKVDIPEDSCPIYIPDLRIKGADSHYMHILTAIARQQELLPNSIPMKDEALSAYIKQLLEANLIVPINDDSATVATTDYILHLNAQAWLTKRSKDKHSIIFEALQTLNPLALLREIKGTA